MVRPGYKQTELGVIPEDWKVVHLQDIGQIFIGLTYKPENVREYGKLVLRSSNIQNDKLAYNDNVYVDNALFLPSRVITEKGDILICVRNGSRRLIGKCAIIDEKATGSAFGAFMSVFRSKHSGFVFFQFQSDQIKNQINEIMGATINQITNKDMACFKIPLPYSDIEQQAIAETLSDIDNLIAGQEKLIAKKRDIKTATMQQLLTGKTRLPGFGEGKGYKQTDMGVLPEDWEITTLGEQIFDLRGGASFQPNDFTQDGMLVLPKVAVVRGGILRLREKDLQYCSIKKASMLKKSSASREDIVVVLRDLVPSGPSIGLMVKIPTDDKYILAQGVYAFKVNEQVSADYLIQISNTVPYRKTMNEIMVGSTQVHIRSSSFKKVKLLFPPVQEQSVIANVLSDMDNEIESLQTRLSKTKSVKQGMMQELLTGRTRLI